MMLQEQLGHPQRPPVLRQMPSAALYLHAGLLGNKATQIPATITDVDSLFAAYGTLLASVQPTLKLALLKRQRFSVEGRAQRIASSLAAVNAPQPTDLSLAQWKEIVEEIEEED